MSQRTKEPVRPTCLLIDKIIRATNDLKSELYDYLDDDQKKNVNYYIDDIQYMIEEVRSANGSLRDWGAENAKEADELENELYELKQQIEE